MSALDTALAALMQRHFRARVLLGRNESGVVISYSSPDVMEITGLEPAYRLQAGDVQVRHGTEWRTIEDGQWLNILRLMDPRVYFHKVEESPQEILPNGVYQITGRCSVGDLGYYHPDYIDWLEQQKAIKRAVTFRLSQSTELIEFEQSNLPPFQDETVTVRIEH